MLKGQLRVFKIAWVDTDGFLETPQSTNRKRTSKATRSATLVAVSLHLVSSPACSGELVCCHPCSIGTAKSMVGKQRVQWTGVRPPADTVRADWTTPVVALAKAKAGRPRASPAAVLPIERTRAGALVRRSLDASPAQAWSNAPSGRQEDYGFSLAEHTAEAPCDSVNGMDDEEGGESGDDGSNQDADISHSNAASSAANSRVAALNRELKALELRFFRTREQVEKTREQVT
jgi:hypothetical protein